MAIFKNLTKVPKSTFPKDMVIEETKKKNDEGTMKAAL